MIYDHASFNYILIYMFVYASRGLIHSALYEDEELDNKWLLLNYRRTRWGSVIYSALDPFVAKINL